ncbi:hypothetical protein [Lacipirellula parvula]|uniref:hypothetical protein n=1 Tax=Lacipirellula parvula TaxID=2650471 RepID=UPI0012606839|nr:hypothetical protein [Lacipirellula parvula]
MSRADCVAAETLLLTDERLAEDMSLDSAVRDGNWTPPRIVSEDETGMPAVDETFSSGIHEEIARRRGERLIDRVTDPTSWLMDLRMRQNWSWPTSTGDGDSQSVQFRPTIPFQAWGTINILRVTVPYDVQSDDGAGIGDVEIFDLLVVQESWGRWGVGPSFRLLTDANDDSLQAGPAAAAVTKNRHWTVGVLSQNFLNDDASQSRIQPILAYKFDDAWSVGIGESEFRYDWGSDRWSQLPLGIELDKIVDVWGQKLQLFVNPQYNFARDESNSGWTLFLGLTLLVPEA